MVTIALAQFEGVEDVDANVERASNLVREAAQSGAEIVCFHEFATTVYWCYEYGNEYFAWAQSIPGPATERITKAATESGIDVLYPLYEREEDRYWNTMAVIQPGRGVTGIYRKSHVPRTGAPPAAGRGADEAHYFSPGNTGFKPLETSSGLRIGFLPCYDRHYAEAYRTYALRGAHVVFCPTASYRSFQLTLWVEELQVMAFQHTLYVAGVNRIGPVYNQGGLDKRYPGRSVVVDPMGKIIAGPAGDAEGLTLAEVTPLAVAEAREYCRYYEFRRPDLYGAVANEASQLAT